MIDVMETLEEAKKIPGFDHGMAPYVAEWRVVKAYNGCGPERWPQELRSMLDSLTEMYAAAVIVHDLDFYLSDGTEEKLIEATARFHRNTSAIFKAEYPLVTWKILMPSYRASRAAAWSVKEMLNIAIMPCFSRKAWMEAYKERTV